MHSRYPLRERHGNYHLLAETQIRDVEEPRSDAWIYNCIDLRGGHKSSFCEKLNIKRMFSSVSPEH